MTTAMENLTLERTNEANVEESNMSESSARKKIFIESRIREENERYNTLVQETEKINIKREAAEKLHEQEVKQANDRYEKDLDEFMRKINQKRDSRIKTSENKLQKKMKELSCQENSHMHKYLQTSEKVAVDTRMIDSTHRAKIRELIKELSQERREQQPGEEDRRKRCRTEVPEDDSRPVLSSSGHSEDVNSNQISSIRHNDNNYHGDDVGETPNAGEESTVALPRLETPAEELPFPAAVSPEIGSAQHDDTEPERRNSDNEVDTLGVGDNGVLASDHHHHHEEGIPGDSRGIIERHESSCLKNADLATVRQVFLDVVAENAKRPVVIKKAEDFIHVSGKVVNKACNVLKNRSAHKNQTILNRHEQLKRECAFADKNSDVEDWATNVNMGNAIFTTSNVGHFGVKRARTALWLGFETKLNFFELVKACDTAHKKAPPNR